MPKRSRDMRAVSIPPSPPMSRAKRPNMGSSPSYSTVTVIATTSSSPYSFDQRTSYSVPEDSPTNPFGIRRPLIALSLPCVTGFGRHLPLRLQLIHEGLVGGVETEDKEGVYRIVQVPANYSFRLLHKLILFLFASDAHRPKPGFLGPRKAESDLAHDWNTGIAGHLSAAQDGDEACTSALGVRPQKWNGHVFEVQKAIAVTSTYQLGVIKPNGKTWAKLSSVRERQLFRNLFALPEDADEVAKAEQSAFGEDGNVSWNWEAEDDFTVHHAWSHGIDLKRGVIYHHSPTTAVHITVNTLKLPLRKGAGNKPFVFAAQGSCGPCIRVTHCVPDAEFDNSEGEGIDLQPVDPKLWNAPNAFDMFLAREEERERALRRDSPSLSSPDLELNSEPDMYGILSSDGGISSDGEGVSVRSDPGPMSFVPVTPLPSHPVRRLRVERAQRRIERLTRSGLSEMSDSDDEQDHVKDDVEDDLFESGIMRVERNPFEDDEV